MSQLGIGVMMNELFGNREPADLSAHRGKIIEDMSIVPKFDSLLIVKFTDGTGLRIRDDGRSCCESRYMTTDDDLADFAGGEFYSADVTGSKDNEDSEYDEKHEILFFEVRTSKGVASFATHNEHNGYYGGFYMTVEDFDGPLEDHSA